MTSFLAAAWNFICLSVFDKINWDWLAAVFNHGCYYKLTMDDWKKIYCMLAQDHYIIVTRRNNELSTYLVGLGGLIVTGKFGMWSHSLLNIEDEVNNTSNIKLIEAISSGVQYAPFNQVFDCDWVCLMRPNGFTAADWTAAMDKAISDLGKPYDVLFNINQQASLSCVELVRNALQAAPDYATSFPQFEAMVQKYGRVLPQMVYDSGEFVKVLEIRR